MNDLATTALNHAATSPESSAIFALLLSLAGIVILIVAIVQIITNLSRTRTDGAKSVAEGHLYTQLSEQAERHARALDDAYRERNERIDAELKGLREYNMQLELKLEAKDKLIAARDDRIQELFVTIMGKEQELGELRERIHALELRLANDESKWPQANH